MEDDILTRSYSEFCAFMKYENMQSPNAIMEFGLYLSIPVMDFLKDEATFSSTRAEQKAALLLGPNSKAIFAVYKTKRFSMPRRLLVQPRKFAYGGLLLSYFLFTKYADIKENVINFLWRRGWL